MNETLAKHLQQQQDRSTRLKGLLSTMALLDAEGWSGGKGRRGGLGEKERGARFSFDKSTRSALHVLK